MPKIRHVPKRCSLTVIWLLVKTCLQFHRTNLLTNIRGKRKKGPTKQWPISASLKFDENANLKPQLCRTNVQIARKIEHHIFK